jgi:RNA polymerase sigma-70 factor (ECF subfamily)
VASANDAVEVYRKYGPALVRKAERILLNPDDAGDIVQGLFVDLIKRGKSEVELPYLYRAVTNRCLNLIRDRQNRRRLLEKQEPALRGAARTRCDEQVIGLDLIAKLAGRLDKRSLEILVCRYVDDMTQEETAELLGTSRKTVGKKLARIREHVRALAEPAEEVAR